MKHSESITKLAAALHKAQGEMENAHKNALNPHFKNRYADLVEILATVKPVLTSNGITVTQFPGYENGITTVETILMHSSGEWVAGVAGARVQKDDPQGVGSAISYLRRYSLAAVCGIAQEDDDGNAASSRESVGQQHAPRPAEPRAPHPNSTPVGVKHSNAPDLYEEVLQVGKHKGRSWGWLLEHHPDYVEWAVEKMDRLAPEAKQLLRAGLELHKVPTPGRDTAPLSEPEPDPFKF